MDIAGIMGDTTLAKPPAFHLDVPTQYDYHGVFGWRPGRTRLARLYSGSHGRKTGALAWKFDFGFGLGFLAPPAIFIPGLSQTYMPFAGFLLITIGSSWFLAWVRQSSGKKILAGMVAHGWANSFISLFPPLIMVEQTAQPRFWIWGGLTFLMGLITMFIRSRKMTG